MNAFLIVPHLWGGLIFERGLSVQLGLILSNDPRLNCPPATSHRHRRNTFLCGHQTLLKFQEAVVPRSRHDWMEVPYSSAAPPAVGRIHPGRKLRELFSRVGQKFPKKRNLTARTGATRVSPTEMTRR